MLRFLRNDEGATAIEYAFICAVIVLIFLVGLIVLGSNVGSSYNNTANKVSNAMSHT